MKKIHSRLLCLCLVLGLLSGCGTPEPPRETQAVTQPLPAVETPDTLHMTIPQGDHGLIPQWIREFERLHPHLTVEILREPEEKYHRHLLVAAREGRGPDIALVSGDDVGKFVQMGLGVDLSLYLPPERLEDYDRGPLTHMSQDGTVYGLPFYAEVWGLGGNRKLLEAAGVDIPAVQTRGWQYSQFQEAVAAGTVKGKNPRDTVYGFVFPYVGEFSEEAFRSFGAGAGISRDFTAGGKYTMTSRNMLELLQVLETLVESGNLPAEQSTRSGCLERGLSGTAMLVGGVTPLEEELVRQSNTALSMGTDPMTRGAKEAEFVFLPTPSMPGCPETSYGTVMGFMAMRNHGSTDEHLQNVALLLDFLCSGRRAAQGVNFWYLDPLCRSGREARGSTMPRDQENLASATRSAALIAAPVHEVPRQLREDAQWIMRDIILPGVNRLRSGSYRAENLYGEICKAAFAHMGEENCIRDALPAE